MLDYRFIHGDPANKPSSGYAGRIPYETWSKVEAVIRQMYAQGSTREVILYTLKEQHDFQPSVGQLRDQMTRWGLSLKRKARGRSCLTKSKTPSSMAPNNSITTTELLRDIHAMRHCNLVSVTDYEFEEQWSQRSSSNLQPKMAEEMEILGNMLFSSRRYAAAFEVFAALYHQILRSQDLHGHIAICALHEAMAGCKRSAANASQRSEVSAMIQDQPPWLSEIGPKACVCLDGHFARSIKSRHKAMDNLKLGSHVRPFGLVLAEVSSGYCVSDWEFVFECTDVLQRYYDLLNTSSFHHFYGQEMTWYKDKSKILSQSASESTIYWYLVSTIAGCPPRLGVSRTSASVIMFSSHETVAFVAALLSHDSMRLSCDRHSPSVFRLWLQTLLSKNDSSLQAAFNKWKNTSGMNLKVPKSGDEPNINSRHALQELPPDRMPDLQSLMALAERTRLARKWVPDDGDRHPTHNNVFDSDPKMWDNADDQCKKCLKQSSQEKGRTSGSEDAQSMPIAVSYSQKLDPPLNLSPHASNCSSYRSFQSTHMRSRAFVGLSQGNVAISPNTKLDQNLDSMSKSSSPSHFQSSDPTISPPLRASDHKSYQIFQSTYLRTISQKSNESDNDIAMTDFYQSPSSHLPLSDIDEILVI